MLKTKKIITNILASAIAIIVGLSPLAYSIRVNAWGTPINSGIIHMTDSSRSAQLFNSSNDSDTISCNAKAVERDGKWVPVYCIEKGKSLNSGDTVNAEMYENGDWSDRYGMSIRDAIGMIYVCGYNGENGWGVLDTNIYNQDASADDLMANGNYHKYVATQALIWEVVSGNTFYSRNNLIQGEIDVLRGRINNYRNRSARGQDYTGGFKLYGSESEAQSHVNGPTSIEPNGTAHFAFEYGAYNPANASERIGSILNFTSSDFTTTVTNTFITLKWNRLYNGGVEAGQGGEVIYDLDNNDSGNLWGVILWRPENGNQLCVSATATAEKVYASFKYNFTQAEYQALATLNTTKVDDLGNPSRGASFTVYDASGNPVGKMTDPDNNGHYTFTLEKSVFADSGNVYFDKDENGNDLTGNIVRNYSIKETSPATEVFIDGEWKSASFTTDDTTYSISITLVRSTGKMSWTASGTSGGSANRSGRTTSGTISFGTAGKDGATVNYKLVDAKASFTIKKVDELGNDARGATFGVFTDSNCTKEAKVVINDPDNDGVYESSLIFWSPRTRSEAADAGVYYIKELTPATQIKVNGKWQDVTCELDSSVRTVRIVWNPSNGDITAYMYEGAVTNFNNATVLATKSGSYDGVTSSVSADFTLAPWKNTPYVYAKGDVTIKKVDDQGRPARGAVFKVYSDEKCTKEVATMTDSGKNGTYAFDAISFAKTLRSSTKDQTKVFYIKETSPATEVFFDGKWIEISCKGDSTVRKITVTWTPSNGVITAAMTDSKGTNEKVTGSYDITTYTSVVHADFTKAPVVNPITSTGSMKIEKYDEATGERLTGAAFKVYNDVNANGKYDSKDTVYRETLKDDDGDGIYILDGMPIDHSYLVIETEAPEYYETDPNYYAFKLDPANRDVTVDNMTWPEIKGVKGEFLNHNPIVKTTLTDAETLDHVTVVKENITLVDTVEYNGLHIGESYVMSGTLYDKATGKAITTAEVTFTPEKTAGTVNVTFTVNTEVAKKCTFVAGEKVRHEDSEKWVGIHFDLEDEDQTVRVPDIHTTLTDNSTNEHVASYPTVELTDVVSYENLVPGREYTVVGYLMNKLANEPLKDADGNLIKSSATFTPTDLNGQVSVNYSFDRSLVDNTVIVAFESLYLGDVLIIAHEDINDVDQTVYLPRIHTTLLGKDTDAHVAAQSDKITLVDAVSYTNLLPGKTYSLTGTLINKATEEFLKDKDGKVISTTVEFIPEKSNGTVEVAFTIDSSLLNGQTLVAFEELKYENITIATHNDISDVDQTVDIPDISTTLYDMDFESFPTMWEVTKNNSEVTLIDTVTYENITTGIEYTVYGTLMIKETGEALRDTKGNPVTASASFTPRERSGSVDVVFTVDTTGLENKHLVAYETLEYNNVALVIHADINDVNQTVRVPDIGTILNEDMTLDHVGRIGEKVSLTDTISYTGLVPGKNYRVVGFLYNKDSGEYLVDSNGQKISAETEFTADTANGFVDVDFTVDSSLLSGKTIVAFEEIYYEKIRIAVHADVNDEGQTVRFPQIGTTASVDGNKTFDPEELVTLTDTVSYENLVPGRTYELRGMLMNSDGSVFEPQGTEIVSVMRFVPETVDGSVDITFKFYGKDLKDGQKLVVFEDLYLVQVFVGADGEKTENAVLLTTHSDISDEGQTVTVVRKPFITSTGEGAALSTILGVIAAAIGGVIALVYIKRKKDE